MLGRAIKRRKFLLKTTERISIGRHGKSLRILVQLASETGMQWPGHYSLQLLVVTA